MQGQWGAAALAVAMAWCAPAMAQNVTAPAGESGAVALTSAETVWHMRAALNVAALGCRGPEEAATVAGYNALLAAERAALAEAAEGAAARYRSRFGAAWQARFDDDMTRLYNFWAQPRAHDGFCAVAQGVLRDAAVVEPADFGAFAAAALPRLEQPFAPAVTAPTEVAAATTAPAELASATVTLIAVATPIVMGPSNE